MNPEDVSLIFIALSLLKFDVRNCHVIGVMWGELPPRSGAVR